MLGHLDGEPLGSGRCKACVADGVALWFASVGRSAGGSGDQKRIRQGSDARWYHDKKL